MKDDLMRYMLVFLTVTCGVLLQPCYAAKVKANVQPGADLSRYKTYQWLPPRILTKQGVVENDPVLVPAIKDAVNRQLTGHGLKEVAEGGDLQISAGALTGSVPQLEAVVFPGGQNLMYGTPIATMGRYNKEGTLIVNLIDAKAQKSVWIGMVTESLDNKPGSGQKKLPDAAAKLFKKYPTIK
jgi:hypothetical protein